MQRNIRRWCTLRTWPWFKLYASVKPLIAGGKANEEADKIKEELKSLEEKFAKVPYGPA